MKSSKRALRRAHAARLLQRCRVLVRRRLPFTPPPNDETIERAARQMLHARTPCSCAMCRNPRRTKCRLTERLTIQERRANQDVTEAADV